MAGRWTDLFGKLLVALAILALATAVCGQPASRPTPAPASRPHHRQAARLIKQLELPARKAEAVRQVLMLGKDAVPDLGRALHDPRPDVVLCVAQMLRMLGPNAKAALADMEWLAKSPDAALANAARFAMSAVRLTGLTVVSVYDKGELRELDAKGKIVHTITGLAGIFDAKPLPNGNYLVSLINGGTVKEINRKGEEIWSKKGLAMPTAAQRLPGGNTLICETSKKRVVEVDSKGKEVWKVDANGPYNATRLPSGNTLIAEYAGNRVVEVDAKGKVVWKVTGITGAINATRLANGNTLIAQCSGRRVCEVDPKGKTVFEIKNLTNPYAALRLANGHTLVSGTTGIGEYDKNGKKLWHKHMGITASVDRY